MCFLDSVVPIYLWSVFTKGLWQVPYVSEYCIHVDDMDGNNCCSRVVQNADCCSRVVQHADCCSRVVQNADCCSRVVQNADCNRLRHKCSNSVYWWLRDYTIECKINISKCKHCSVSSFSWNYLSEPINSEFQRNPAML